jgi:short-subunit dehydrogenase
MTRRDERAGGGKGATPDSGSETAGEWGEIPPWGPGRWRRVLITGASSGLGAALAAALARPGVALHLGGRDAARLAEVAGRCQAQGAEVHPFRGDLRARGWIGGVIAAAAPLDLVIANAGISGPAGAEDGEAARALFETNLLAAIETVSAAAPVMACNPPDRRGIRGGIAVVASLAAFVPAPQAPSYAASKAALDAWAVANAPRLRAQGILITSLCPGFVATPLVAANDFPMPFLMRPERAAARMLRGIARGRVRVAFPWPLGWMARLWGLLPAAHAPFWLDRMGRKRPGPGP